MALFAIVAAGMFTGCVDDEDTQLPNYKPVIFGEDFEVNAADNTLLVTPGWINFAEEGTALWKIQEYDSFYAEFSAFTSGNAVNTAWLVSPSFTLGTHPGEKLVFQSSQSYVTSAANTLEVLISTDFDGTNVTAANWEVLNANFPTAANKYFEYVKSGQIDLSAYSGKANIAFRYKGSGTNTALDGSYQIDQIRVFY